MIRAIAFDIDGTLYNQHHFNFRTIPFVVANAGRMLCFKKVRRELHAECFLPESEQAMLRKEDFFTRQAKLLAKYSHLSPEKAKNWIHQNIYTNWKKIFEKVSPYPHSLETIKALKERGFKIGLLSDFPPEQKGDVWGIKPFCDVILGSEYCNALKPSSIPFIELSKGLDCEPSSILYVGNSYKYDVLGAKAVGMKTALICRVAKKKAFLGKADILFSNYKELLQSILQIKK